MTETETVVTRFLGRIEAGDLDGAMALLAPDVSWRSAGLVFDAGRREWASFRARTSRLWEEEDGRATALGRYAGVHRETGRALDAGFTHRFTVREGAIAGFDETVEAGAVRTARGLEAAPPGRRRSWTVTATGLDSLELRDGSELTAGDGEAIVRVEAVGLNFADVMQAEGRYPGGPTPPYVPGFELAGTVCDVRGGAGPSVGDRVAGIAPGALADRMRVPLARLRPIPPAQSAADAAAGFVARATAHACAVALGGVSRGERVLVTAAASSVGLAAIALAKARGAIVSGTASSPAKLRRATAAGLDHAVLSSDPGWADSLRARCPEGFDLVLESAGGETYERCLALLRPFGRLVVYGNASGRPGATPSSDALLFVPRTVIGFELGALLARPDASRLLPGEPETATEPPTLWSFERAADALRAMQARRTIGKQVVIVDSP